MSKTVDARGLSCPQPVMLALKAIESDPGEVLVQVDHETAAENVQRASRDKGRTAEIVEAESGYSVKISAK